METAIPLHPHLIVAMTPNNTVLILVKGDVTGALLELTVEDFLMLRDELRFHELTAKAVIRTDLRDNTYTLMSFVRRHRQSRSIVWGFQYHIASYVLIIDEGMLLDQIESLKIDWNLMPE